MKAKQYPNQNEIREWFEYRNGELYWKINKAARIKIGQLAGVVNKEKYKQVGINGKIYLQHRLIWIMFNGDISDNMVIDHINRNKTDNRIENLRIVSRSINRLNTNSKNITTYNLAGGEIAYRGKYAINGKELSKSFDTEQKAIDWVTKKKSEIFENSSELS